MAGMPRTEPTVIRSRTKAEFIASLPRLAGMPLRNSIVVAPFWGKRTTRAIRIDLPAERTHAASQRVAASLLAYLARLNGCDTVAVAIFTDEPYAEAFRGREDLMDHLLERVRSSGFDIIDASIVAGDGWGCFFDDTVEEPRSLAEIEAATPARAEEDAFRAPRELPIADPEISAIVEKLLLNRLVLDADVDAFGLLRRAPLPDPIALLESALSGDPSAVGPQTLAHLIALIDSEGAVDRTVLQIAFGRDVGAHSWQTTLSVRRRATEAECEPMDILMRDHEAAGGFEVDGVGGMLVGQTSEMPSAARLNAGAELLGRAIAHCPLEERSWAMCALAWVRWALGLTSAADELLRSAARVDPDNGLVPVYHTIITRCLPAWIFSTGAAGPGAPSNRAGRRAAARRKRGGGA